MRFIKYKLAAITWALILLAGRLCWAGDAPAPEETKIKSIFIREDTTWEGRIVIDGLIKVVCQAG
jgi:hypothetical protein